MNWIALGKTAFASIGGGAAASAIAVLHAHKFSEPMDWQNLSSAALVGAVIGLANLFMHPPGAGATATQSVTITTQQDTKET